MKLQGRRRKLLFSAKAVVFDTTVNPPIIYSSGSVSCDENTTLAHALTANESVTWTIVGGADSARFEISGSTLRWLGNGTKDYDSPNDANADNVYIVTVRATDLQAQTTDQTITVTVVSIDVAPDAPVLDLTSGESDNTPDFTLTGDLVLGDSVRLEYATSAVFTGGVELANTIDAGEDAANSISFSTGPLAATTWYFRARIVRPGFGTSNWSNTETITLITVGYDAATTAWVNAVVAAGGTVSTTQKDRVDALIVGLKTDGLFSVNSRLWIHAGESVAKQATIDLMGLAVCTLTVAPTLGASGYTGNGTSQYIDYGGPPSDFVQDSCSFGAYNTLFSTTVSNDCIIGWFDNVYGTLCDILPLQSGSGAINRVHQVGGSMSGGNTNRKGMFLSTRRASTDAELYYNGSSVATSANASQTTLAPRNLYGLARNDVSAIVGYSVDVIAIAWIGPGLSDTQAGNLSARINTYMTSWGINVY